MVKIYHPHEPFETFDVKGLWILLNGLDLGRKWQDAILADAMSQKVYFRYTELAFLQLDDKAMVLKSVEEGDEVLLVLRGGFARDQNVVQIYE